MNQLAIKAAVRQRDGFRCLSCGMTAEEHIAKHGRTLDVHRVVPGSPYSVDGCQTLCKACHGDKPKQPYGASREQASFRPDDPRLADALTAYAKSIRRTRNMAIVLLLEEGLKAAGFWPPPSIEPEPGDDKKPRKK